MREAAIRTVTHHQACKLLHNKFVVVIGDSIQRSVYKDLVLLLQRDTYLSLSQLKSKGELSFEQDSLVEGGRLGKMTNGTEYKEIRQYRTDHHLIRFYFITRVFSQYMESILADFKNELKPDLVIVNSCVWDVSRYNRKWVHEYRENLDKLFTQLRAVLPEKSLVVWNMTMPLGQKIIGGFLVPEIEYMGPMLRYDVIEANFYGATMADVYGLDVLDLHFLFRFSLHHRMNDGVHWNAVVHRQITFLLLAHAAQAWGVQLPKPTVTGQSKMLMDSSQALRRRNSRPSSSWTDPGHYRGSYNPRKCSNHYMEPNAFNYQEPVWQRLPQYNGFGSYFYEDTLPAHSFGAGYSTSPVYNGSGPYFYEDTLPAHLQFRAGYSTSNGGNFNLYHHSHNIPVSAAPYCSISNFVMKQKRGHRHRQYNPYSRRKPSRLHRY